MEHKNPIPRLPIVYPIGLIKQFGRLIARFSPFLHIPSMETPVSNAYRLNKCRCCNHPICLVAFFRMANANSWSDSQRRFPFNGKNTMGSVVVLSTVDLGGSVPKAFRQFGFRLNAIIIYRNCVLLVRNVGLTRCCRSTPSARCKQNEINKSQQAITHNVFPV